MKMTIVTLEGMRSEERFLLFWERTEKKRQELGVEAPQLPRQRKVPRRLEVGVVMSLFCSMFSYVCT